MTRECPVGMLDKYDCDYIGIAVIEEIINPDFGYPITDIGRGIKNAYRECRDEKERDMVSRIVCAITGFELETLLKKIDDGEYPFEEYDVDYERDDEDEYDDDEE